MNQESFEQATARAKSYTGYAMVVFFLYGLLWIPGLIFNIVYVIEATTMQHIAGRKLPGVTLLQIMLGINIFLGSVGALLACLLAYLLFAGALAV